MHQEKADHRALEVGPWYDRSGKGRGFAVGLALKQSVYKIRMLAQEHRQWPRPDAVGVIFPEKITATVAIDEQVGIDHSAARLHVAYVIAQSFCADRPASNQGGSIVDPGAKRRGCPGKADRKLMVLSPSREDQPILLAGLVHFGRPKVGFLSPFSSPFGLSTFGEGKSLELPMHEI